MTPSSRLAFGKGYDHNWVLRGDAGQVRKAVELYEPKSGRLMTVYTDQPGMQFYSGNFLDGTATRKKWRCIPTPDRSLPGSPGLPGYAQ